MSQPTIKIHQNKHGYVLALSGSAYAALGVNRVNISKNTKYLVLERSETGGTRVVLNGGSHVIAVGIPISAGFIPRQMIGRQIIPKKWRGGLAIPIYEATTCRLNERSE